MHISEVNLLDFMGGYEGVFAIPLYQRPYSWGLEQCEELWRDLHRAARAQRSHFLGTVIYSEVPSGEGEAAACRYVVDGQQRLTTVAILMEMLARHMRAADASLFGVDADGLCGSFLYWQEQPKLRLSRADDASFKALLEGNDAASLESRRMGENAERFSELMDENGFDEAELWRGLQSLSVIAVTLDDATRAPEVFESFNSKGVPLVTADLVRNFLLLAESHAEQTRLFQTYWEPIQGVFGDDPGSIRLNNAILGWLAVRLRKVRKFGDEQAFSIFKSFCEDEYEGTVDDLLDELYAFCMVWAENYRYHAVKKYKTADWAKLGHKTRVSGRPRAKLDNASSKEYYQKHFGVDPQW